MTTVPTETTLSHTDRARAVIEHLRGIRELVDGFTFDFEPDARTLNAAKAVPDAFLEEVAVAIEASEHLAQSSQVTPAELRDTASFSIAFKPVLAELFIVDRAVRQAVAKKRAGVCKRALQTYSMAKAYGRRTDRQVLMPHLDAMKTTLGVKRSAKRAGEKPEEPGVAPDARGGANA